MYPHHEHHSLSSVLTHTRASHVHELQMTWSILSAGAEDDDILFEDELRRLSEERKARKGTP